VSDSYYELIDDADPLGEKFAATDLVRGTWTAAIQHAAPVSALLVCALQRCAPRDDIRLSRVVIDLLGPVPAEGDLWVRPRLECGGKQIELVTAEMLGLGPNGEPRPRSEGRNRNPERDWDRNYVHSLDWRWLTLNEGPESWIKPLVDLVKGETMTPLERLFAVADCANDIGSKLDITNWTFLNTDLAVHVFRIPDGEWDRYPRENELRPRRHRDDGRHLVRRARRGRRHRAVRAGTPAPR